jgi:hypothetical protein
MDIHADVLVVGGGTGGVAAAIQSARRGAKTVLVSEFNWLGGMLTSAGVTAPDGLELLAFQTGIWGAFLRELQARQPQGLDHAWVSFFTYEPRTGAEIFADWVQALPNLQWISGQIPLEVQKQGDRVIAVRFSECTVQAQITLDATELGDLLALAEVPYRWGWEWQSAWQEPSAPVHPNTMTQAYAVQAPTWVFVMQALNAAASTITLQDHSRLDSKFSGTWESYGPDQFLNYGRLPGNRFMINWPEQGNDYGLQAERLIQSDSTRQAFLQDAYNHAQDYANWLQQELRQSGCHYGLASDVFPVLPNQLGGEAFALHPYYRESRRLQGLTTLCEQDILPLRSGQPAGQVAALPTDTSGQVSAIAIGNYVNDHHYPGFRLPLQPKALHWGGRWTGTPFALPYGCLVPATTDGLLVCEKNISVSHIANGATRLQPTVLGLGQAAGMAAALCIQQNCQPRDLPVRMLQTALLQDPTAPMAIVPLFNLLPTDPDWQHWQQYYLDHPEQYPMDGQVPEQAHFQEATGLERTKKSFTGCFQRRDEQDYQLHLSSFEAAEVSDSAIESLQLVTLHPEINAQLKNYKTGQQVQVQGRLNRSGNWLLVEAIGLKH